MVAKCYQNIVTLHPIEMQLQVFLGEFKEESPHRPLLASQVLASEVCLTERLIAYQLPNRSSQKLFIFR
jgi:hypothetical protein